MLMLKGLSHEIQNWYLTLHYLHHGITRQERTRYCHLHIKRNFEYTNIDC